MSTPQRAATPIVLFILLLLQAGFGLVMGSALLLVGILALPAGTWLGGITLATAAVVVLLAVGALRAWRWTRYTALVFEIALAFGGLLALLLKPDLLALLTSVGVPVLVSWLLVYRWPARITRAETQPAVG